MEAWSGGLRALEWRRRVGSGAGAALTSAESFALALPTGTQLIAPAVSLRRVCPYEARLAFTTVSTVAVRSASKDLTQGHE